MSILDLFARSPFRPMQEHMRVAVECARQLPPLIDATCRGELREMATLERQIDELEGRADQLKNDLRAHLPRRLFLPVDRRDLLEILDLQDRIADTAQDVASLIVERQMELPAVLQEDLQALGRGVADAAAHAGAVIDELDELVELGFRGREADRVEQMINEVCRREGECDDLERRVRRQLVGLEETLPPVSAVFLYELVAWIGDVADHAEKVANRARLLIAR